MGRIKNYKNMSKEKLLIALIKSEQSLDEVYNKAEENKVEETKEYPDRYDSGYKVIWDAKNLFDEINEDYYEPVKTKIAFKVNYIEYESKGDRDKNLSSQEYLNMIRPYLRDLINNHKASLDGSLGNNLHGERKIQSTMQINFVSSLDPEEIRTMDSKSNNIEILMGSETDDIINELFRSFLQLYQEKLGKKMRDSKLVFENVDLLYYSLHKTTLARAESYIEFYEWIRNKKATIKPKNYDDNNCYQYSIIFSLNYQNIENHPEEISKIKPFINKYNWKDIDFPSNEKDWNKFEQSNKKIALNILLAPHNTKTIRFAYKSKYKRERENKVVLLMITDGKKWHYLALKRKTLN